jgi:aminopeptidase N
MRGPLLICIAVLAAASSSRGERLPLVALPEHYDLAFTPRLTDGVFEGTSAIRVRVLQPTATIVLNAAELAITSAHVEADGRTHAPAVVLDSRRETATLQLGERIGVGPAVIRLAFRGALEEDLRGLYLSHAGGRRYAVTQLEATDARRMFPSFDEPDAKATFAIAATVAEHDTAISNGALLSDEPGPYPGTHTLRFATTAPIPSYLVALAVGDFTCQGRSVGAVPLRVCAAAGRDHLTGFALDAAAALLDYLNGYMAIDYPFGKLDLVAIPDFAAGAMENPGAIFFREALLLVDGETASLATQKRVALVIAHELAHQWFGNLVTMRWWNDLWLNEGFATWMETKAVDAWKPEWEIDLDALISVQGAAAIDLLESTRPIRAVAETPAEIGELFDPIAYEKGAAVVRMAERFAGERAFQGAVNAYLELNAFANATAEDFWSVAARATGRPELSAVIRSFVEQPGIPELGVNLQCGAGQAVVSLSQRRAAATAAGATRAGRWSIPVCIRHPTGVSADTVVRCVLLDEPAEQIVLDRCVPWIVANVNAAGYYRTFYDRAMLEALSADFSELTPAERIATANDVWAAVRAGRTDVSAFLSLLTGLRRIEAPAFMDLVAARLAFVHEYLTTETTRRAFEAKVRALLRPLLAAIEPDHPRLRARALQALGATGADPEVLKQAAATVADYLAAPAVARIEPALLDTFVRLAAHTGGARLYQEYVRLAGAADTPEQRYRFLFALAEFRDPALVERTVHFALSPAVRAQDAAALVARVLDHPPGRRVAWPVLQRRWSEVQAKVAGFAGTGRIIEALGAFCDPAASAEVDRFFATRSNGPAERTLQQTLDRIQTCAALAQRQQDVLRQWLRQN